MTQTIQNKRELKQVQKNSVKSINGINCVDFDFSKKTVTVYTGNVVYLQYNIRCRETVFLNYPITVTQV